MKRIMQFAAGLALLASIASAFIWFERQVNLNGRPFAKAVPINGVIAISVEDLVKGAGGGPHLEPAFNLSGKTLRASMSSGGDKGAAQQYTIKLQPHALFRVRKAGVVSRDVFMKNGKAYVPLADVAQAFGIIVNWSKESPDPINLNTTANSDAILVGL
jgi:hypothetical protein